MDASENANTPSVNATGPVNNQDRSSTNNQDNRNGDEVNTTFVPLLSIGKSQVKTTEENQSNSSSFSSSAMALKALSQFRKPIDNEDCHHSAESKQNELSDFGRGLQIAIQFVNSSDKNLRKRAGECISALLHGTLDREICENCDSKSKLSGDDPNSIAVTADELQALSLLAMSPNPSIRYVMGGILHVLASHENLSRGNIPLKKSLNDSLELIKTESIDLECFAIEMIIEIASHGSVWRERIIESGWLSQLLRVLHRITATTGESKRQISGRSPRDRQSITSDADLHFGAREIRLFKLSLEFIRSLHLDETLRVFVQQNNKKMVQTLNDQRLIIIKLLCRMIDMCSVQDDLHVLRQIFAALSGAMKNLHCENACSNEIESFVNQQGLESMLDLIDDAASEYQLHAEESYSQASEFQNSDPRQMYLPVTRDADDGLGTEVHESKDSFSKFLLPELLTNSFTFTASHEPISRASETPFSSGDAKLRRDNVDHSSKMVQIVTLMIDSLLTLRIACINSSYIANAIAEAFEVHGLMRVMNLLFRSRVPGAKTAIAEFMFDLCNNISEENKISLSESGIIVRLIRLASPSSVYQGALQNNVLLLSDEAAFIPAIKALGVLARIDGNAARIIIAGGVGPLYSHANSTRPSRDAARKTLEYLGVNDINELISLWKSHKATGITEQNSEDTWTNAATNRRDSTATLVPKMDRLTRMHSILGNWKRGDRAPLLRDKSVLFGDAAGKTSFKNAEVLGSGAFATVYLGYVRECDAMLPTSTSTHQGHDPTNVYVPVAVKKLTEAAFSQDDFLEEIRILSKVPPHKNITNLFMVCFDARTLMIVMEMGGHKTLSWHLATANKKTSSKEISHLCTCWNARLQILIGISDALKTLQSMDPVVLHLDIKSCNILIADQGNGEYIAKLCDFGLAVEMKPGYSFLSPANHGTLQWMAPEVMREEEVELSKGYDQSADTFSFGVLMWEMAHPGRVPWDELAVDVNLDSIQERIKELVLGGRRMKCENTSLWPNGYLQLMRRCWSAHPSSRPKFVGSFLMDPDSMTQGDKTIGVTLKHILWDRLNSKTSNLSRATTSHPDDKNNNGSTIRFLRNTRRGSSQRQMYFSNKQLDVISSHIHHAEDCETTQDSTNTTSQ